MTEPVEKNETLGEALPREMARVRDLLPLYDAIPTGIFAATMMQVSACGKRDTRGFRRAEVHIAIQEVDLDF